MALDVLTAAPGITAAEALREAGGSRALQPEVLTSVYLVGEGDRLTGAVTLVDLLQADAAAPLEQLADADPVRVVPDTDIEDVALLMTDYNLLTVPVVDDEDRILGVITVDDVLEVIIPPAWRRRGHAPRPPGRPERESPASP
ncbi:CBS domain-containing protein [Streptomyces sp. NPDC055036]